MNNKDKMIPICTYKWMLILGNAACRGLMEGAAHTLCLGINSCMFIHKFKRTQGTVNLIKIILNLVILIKMIKIYGHPLN